MVDLGARGLRNPQHNFLVSTSERYLFPFLAAPVRPMETIVGWRLQAESMFSRMVKSAWAPPIEMELGLWMFPISDLGPEFTDLFVADLEDITNPGNVIFGKKGSGVRRPSLPIDEQGSQTHTALQTRNRPWAGEVGQASTEMAIDDEAAYSPYVSAGTYHVARWFYEMDMETGEGGAARPRTDDDLWQAPPRVGNNVRGATASMANAGTALDDQIPIASISEWAERLSIVSRADQTYVEYLESFGVPRSRIRGMPEPLTIMRRKLRPQGSSQAIGNVSFNAGQPTVQFKDGQTNRPMEGFGNADWRMMADVSGLRTLSTSWDQTRQRRLMATEPSMILGTVCFWVPEFEPQFGGHVMDMTRLVTQGVWGPPDPDELDFVTVQDVRGPSDPNATLGPEFGRDDTDRPMEDRDGGTGPWALNMLNLFLHGDTFTNDPWAFGFYGPGATLEPPADIGTAQTQRLNRGVDWVVNTMGNLRFGVATEMVN